MVDSRNYDGIRNRANLSSEVHGQHGVNFDDSLMTSGAGTQLNNSQFMGHVGTKPGSTDESRNNTQDISKMMVLNSDYQENNAGIIIGGKAQKQSII